jgi:hypothetical protein
MSPPDRIFVISISIRLGVARRAKGRGEAMLDLKRLADAEYTPASGESLMKEGANNFVVGGFSQIPTLINFSLNKSMVRHLLCFHAIRGGPP